MTDPRDYARIAAALVILALCPALASGAGGFIPEVRGTEILSHDAGPTLEASVQALIEGAGRRPFWVGYAVPSIDASRQACCVVGDDYEEIVISGKIHLGDGADEGVCALENESYVIFGRGSSTAEAGNLLVLFRVHRGEIVQLKMASPHCTLKTGSLTLHWLHGVSEAESVTWLDSLVERSPTDEEVAERALAALAQHGGPAADPAASYQRR
jgi:hypothetical protein